MWQWFHVPTQFQDLLDQTDKNVEALEEYLEFCDKVLHDDHYLRIIAKRYLSQLYDAKVHKDNKIRVLKDLLEIFNKLDPGLSQSRGLTLFELTKTMPEKSSKKVEILNEVVACLKHDTRETIAGRACQKARLALDNA